MVSMKPAPLRTPDVTHANRNAASQFWCRSVGVCTRSVVAAGDCRNQVDRRRAGRLQLRRCKTGRVLGEPGGVRSAAVVRGWFAQVASHQNFGVCRETSTRLVRTLDGCGADQARRSATPRPVPSPARRRLGITGIRGAAGADRAGLRGQSTAPHVLVSIDEPRSTRTAAPPDPERDPRCSSACTRPSDRPRLFGVG